MKILYTAIGTATDEGRSGRAGTDDGRLDVQLSLPEALGGAGGDGTFALQAKLEVLVPKLDQAGAEELVALAHDRCPYSRATRGNIEVELSVRGGS